MKEVFAVSDNILSPLGWSTGENFAAMLAGFSGVRRWERESLSPTPFQASLLDDAALAEKAASLGASGGSLTRFEKIAVLSISEALPHTTVQLDDPQTVFILSTTKGNTALLENGGDPASLPLHAAARKIAAFFRHPNLPVVVSHACASGVAAILTAGRLLRSGLFQHAVIAGADEVSRFVLSGFQALQALSDEPCRPFDDRRRGLNLGEGGGTLVLSVQPETALDRQPVRLAGGAASNDANHISGPSRTGEELSQAVCRALEKSGLKAADMDFVSAHGTATPFNDEMEAKAFDLAGLGATPLNSLKGFFGHTLGAAGVIESAISIQSLRENAVLPSRGFEVPGVSRPVNVCREVLRKDLRRCLKTASGFGGCNAAVVFEKNLNNER